MSLPVLARGPAAPRFAPGGHVPTSDSPASDPSTGGAPDAGVPNEESPPPPTKPRDRATREDYTLDPSPTSSTLAVEAPGILGLRIVAKNGTKVHPQAPLELRVQAPEGLRLEKGKLSRSDVVAHSEAGTELRTEMRALRAGRFTVAGELSFFLCTDAWCQRMTDEIQFEIEASAAPSP